MEYWLMDTPRYDEFNVIAGNADSSNIVGKVRQCLLCGKWQGEVHVNSHTVKPLCGCHDKTTATDKVYEAWEVIKEGLCVAG